MEYLSDHEFNRIILTEPKENWFDLVLESKRKLNEVQFELICGSDNDPSWGAHRMVDDKMAPNLGTTNILEISNGISI